MYIGNSPINGYFQLDDLQRIEVLRGPQGTLYGAGSLGGALRVIPNAPKLGTWEGSVEVSGGYVEHASDAAYGTSAVINIPLGDTVAFRASGKYQYLPGFIDTYGLIKRTGDGFLDQVVLANPADVANSTAVFYRREDANDSGSFTGRAALRWEPSDRFNAELAFMYGDVDGQGAATMNPDFAGGSYPLDPRIQLPAGNNYRDFTATEQPFDRQTSLTSLDLSYDVGFATVSATSSYYTSKGSAITDLTYTIAGIPGYVEYYAGTPVNPRFVQLSQYEDDTHTFSQEVRLVSTGGEAIDYALGFFYEEQSSKAIWSITNPGASAYTTALGCTGPYFGGASFPDCLTVLGPNEINALQRDKQTFDSTSFFGELTWHFIERGQITLGARHFKQDFVDAQRYTLYTFGFDQNTRVPKAATKSVFKVNPSFEYLPGQHVYAVWSQGFRRGGATALSTEGFLAENPILLSYESDTTNNYELGLKGRFDNNVSYTVALFNIEWDKPQIAGSTPWGNQAVWNAPEARSRGVEFELTAPLGLSGLSVALGGAYTDAELTKDYLIEADSNGNITGSKGQQLPGSSEWSGTATINYERTVAAGYDLFVSLNDTYRSEMFQSTFPVSGGTEIPVVPSMNLVNLAVSVKHDAWRIGLYATNLFGKVAYQSTPFNPGRLDSLDNAYLLNMPRQIELRIGYSL